MKSTQGKRLKELLKIYGITQSEFAKRFQIPKSSMSMYLSDDRKMKQDRLKQIANSFGINEAWIMGYDLPMTKAESNPIETQMDAVSKLTGQLIELFESLNKEGQNKVIDYTNDLVQSRRYSETGEE